MYISTIYIYVYIYVSHCLLRIAYYHVHHAQIGYSAQIGRNMQYRFLDIWLVRKRAKALQRDPLRAGVMNASFCLTNHGVNIIHMQSRYKRIALGYTPGMQYSHCMGCAVLCVYFRLILSYVLDIYIYIQMYFNICVYIYIC